MSFKKILAVMLAAVTACSISAAALTLDVAEAAKEANVAEAAALADATDYVVSVNGTSYASLSEALSAVVAGDNTVTFLADISENVTIKQQKNVNITIDGNGKTYSGTITVNGNNRSAGTETLTIKHVNFVAEGEMQTSIDVPKSTQAHNITVENCTFTGKDKTQYGIILRNAHNITIKNITGTKLLDLVYGNRAVTGFTADNITVTDSTNAIYLSYVNSTANITNLKVDVSNAGVHVNNNVSGTVTVTDSTITAEKPLSLGNNSTASVTLVVDGENNFNSTSESGEWLAVGNGNAGFTVEVKDDKLDQSAMGGVASFNGKLYGNLEAAAKAADVAGAAVVIELLDDITLDTGIQFTEATDVTINGNGHTITMIDNPDGGNYSNPHAVADRPTGFSISDDANSEEAGSVFNINNMTIVNEKTLSRYTSGHSWRAAYYAYAYAETTNYNKVNFVGGVSVAQNASFTDCTFTENRDQMFMVFVDKEYSKAGETANVTVNNCSFDYKGEAYGTFKAANQLGAFNLTIENSEFLNCDNIPAITVDANVTGVVKNCVFENCKAGSYGSEEWVNGGPVPAVPTSGSLNGVPFGTGSTVEDLSDLETLVGEENEVHSGSVEVVFDVAEETEEYIVYNINLVASNNGIINRLNSADLTFKLTQLEGLNEYEIIASNSEIAVNPVENSKTRYEFHYKNKNDNVVTDTAKTITLGQVKLSGYGKFIFEVDTAANTTNIAHSTTLYDNIVESFIPNGEDGTQLGELVLDNATTGEVTIKVPTRKLTVNVTFPNTVVDRDALYQNMTVTVSGGDLAEAKVFNLGADTKADAAYTIEADLTKNISYNVVVSGAGYRTARYTVTMTEAKTLNFWNNVKDNAVEVETGKASSATTKNFLAGDIVADNNINIYDLSAVVSYFATEITDEADYDKYVKYDLNRDGKIDSKDVAYVLVSWGA